MMGAVPDRGAKISKKKGFREAILHFLGEAMEKSVFDGILIPMSVPAGDSYAWVLIRDKSLLDDANPIAPIMPVQGSKALKSLTRKGRGELKIGAVMRPCEIRATVELSKLNQVHLENIILLSYDCPGALSISDYLADSPKNEELFNSLFSKKVWESEEVKTVCRICDHFSLLPATDLHFGLVGTGQESLFLVANSEKGQNVLSDMKIEYSEDVSGWQSSVNELKEKREKKKDELFDSIRPTIEGWDNLLETFSDCIGCHNCGSVCPICYCRHCYFDSEVARQGSELILLKAKKRGGLSLPMDKILYHTGRMSHMSLSCVSCGMCEEACPVSIPVAQIFSYVADKTQRAFDYEAGESGGEVIPIRAFQLEEVPGIKELVDSAEG